MSEKKPYSPPELYRVELNQEQAILSVCSLMSRNPMGPVLPHGRVQAKCH